MGDNTKDNLSQIATLEKDSTTITNVVVLVEGMSSPLNVVHVWDTVLDSSNNGESYSCTLLAVGEMYNGGQDGGYYHIGSLDNKISGDTVDAPKFSSKKAYQLLAHALALDINANQALTAYEYQIAALEAVVAPYTEGGFLIRDEDGNEKYNEYKDIKMRDG